MNNLIKDLCWNNQFTVRGPIDPQELSLSCRMLVRNGQPQVCFSWAIYFSEKHSIIVGTLSGSLCCSCRLKTLTRSFPTKVLAGYPFPTHQIGRQSACQLLCPLLRGLCMSPISPLEIPSFASLISYGHASLATAHRTRCERLTQRSSSIQRLMRQPGPGALPGASAEYVLHGRWFGQKRE